MKRKVIVITVFSLINVFSFLYSKDLTLDQTIQLAEENSKELKLAESELQMADARIDEAWAMALPSISADLNYNRNLKDQIFYVTVPDFQTGESTTQRFDMSFNNEFSAVANLDQTIYSFGKVGTALEIAYQYEDYAKKSFNYTKQQILVNTKISFYSALLAKKIYDLTVESEESAQQNYNETKDRFESGASSEYELLQAEVRWRNAIPVSISAKRDFEYAINNLKTIINMPISDQLSITGSLDDLPAMPSEKDIDAVLNDRPDYQAMLLESSMRDKNVSLEFADHFPTLKGKVSYLFSAQSDEFEIANDFDNYVVGVTLSIPIYSGGNTSAQVQKAHIEYYQSQLRLAQTKEKIEMDLNNVVLDLKEASERINAADKNMSAAQRAFEIAEARLSNGMATQLELKDSRIFLDQAKINNLTARFDYLKAYYQWQLTTGNWQTGH